MQIIASINGDPPTTRDFTTVEAAVVWAREHAQGRTWTVGEVPSDGPARILVSGLADDIAPGIDEPPPGSAASYPES
jgi:hypothetical protein